MTRAANGRFDQLALEDTPQLNENLRLCGERDVLVDGEAVRQLTVLRRCFVLYDDLRHLPPLVALTGLGDAPLTWLACLTLL